MGNIIAIGNIIGLTIPISSGPGVQDMVTELSVQMITENTSQNIITE